MKAIYIGVFLTQESRQKLLESFPARHSTVQADHVTIKFRPSELEVANAPIGHKVKLEVVAEVSDEKGQAVSVRGVLSANRYPHITISCDPANGGTPAYSNELLQKFGATLDSISGLGNPPPNTLTLDGVVDVFPRSN